MVGNRRNNVYRYKFLLVFFNSFFKLLYYSYEICLRNIERIHAAVEELHQFRVEIEWTMRWEFLFIFFNSFFKLLYYSYKICLLIIKRIRAAVEELHQFWVEIGWTMSTGASFCSFSLILFLNCSTIATKSVYKISKGSVQRLKSYRFGWKLHEQCLQVGVFVCFL